jgi:PAS domain S-box-containing protein
MYDNELMVSTLRKENHELRAQLAESEAMLQAIRTGAVDAIVVDRPAGPRFFILDGADMPYREMVETMSEGAVTINATGIILYSNQRFADMLRTDLRTVIGSNLMAYCLGNNATSVPDAIEQSAAGISRIRATLLACDAARVSVNMAMRCHPIFATDRIAIVVSDLTEWQQAEDARERAIRALRIVNSIADIIIHSPDEAGMLSGVCRAIVDAGGYRSARIGAAGCVPAGSGAGCGPVGLGMTGPQTDSALSDGNARPDHGVAGCAPQALDHLSCVTLPLMEGDEFFGCWVICADQPDAFDQDEMNLLATVASDLAFGVAALRNRRMRAQLAAIVESAREPIIGGDPDGTITTWNRAAERLFGYSAAEIVGQPMAVLCPPELVSQADESLAQILCGETVEQSESVRIAKDGRHISVSLTYSPVLDAAGSIAAAAIFVRDNTARKSAEQALRLSEARFRTLLDTLPQKIFLKDRNANFIFCNENFARDFNIAADEISGTNIYAHMPQELADKYLADDRQAMASGQPLDLEEPYIVNGRATVVQTIKVPLRGADGDVIGVLGIFWDISERKQNEAMLRESEQLFHTLTDAMPQMVWMCTPEGLNTYVNQQWLDYTGLTLQESYGRGWNAPIHADETQAFWDAWRGAARTDAAYRLETRLRAADGSYRWFLMKGEPVRDAAGQITKWLGTCTDIDGLKHTQAEMMQHRQHLEASVAVRTADLEKSNQALVSINKELESFSYSVSHDLRAPLRAIDAFSAILLEDYSDRLDADGKRMLGIVRDNAVKMGFLIDDILAFARAGRTAMTMGVIDMNELVRSAVADLAPTTRGRAFEFRIAALPPAYGDGQMIRRVWTNLLDNAIKYTAASQPAIVEVGAREIEGATAYFVRDNGAGFDMRYVGKLFNLFQRLHSAEEFPGTGCGLAIVERIVTRNGGRVWAEGRPDEGATFYFVLPAHEVQS